MINHISPFPSPTFVSKRMWELARSITFIIVVAYITASIYDTPSNLGKNSKRETRNVIVLLLPEFGNVLDGKPCSLPCSNVEKNVIIEFIQMIDAGLMDQFRTDIIIFHEGNESKVAVFFST